MVTSFLDGTLETLEQTYNLVQEGITNSTDRLKNESFYLLLRFLKGDKDALYKLEDLQTQVSGMPSVLPWVEYRLGLAYENGEVYDKAISYYELAQKHAPSKEHKTEVLLRIADCLRLIDKTKEAIDRLIFEVREEKEPIYKAKIFEGIADHAQAEGNWELRALALLKVLEYRPNDTDILFKLGYAFGQKGLHNQSASLYTNLLQIDSNNNMALNNLGVAFSQLKLPFHSVSYFKKSLDKGNSLAGANLALEYIEKGFEDEATKVINKAMLLENIGNNLLSAQATLKNKLDEENKIEGEITRYAREQRQFLIQYANAFVDPTPIEVFDTGWSLPTGTTVEVTRNDSSLTITWGEGGDADKITGIVHNRAIKVTHYKKGLSFMSNSQPRFVEAGEGYAYLNEEKTHIRIMNLSEHKHVFMELIKSEPENSL